MLLFSSVVVVCCLCRVVCCVWFGVCCSLCVVCCLWFVVRCLLFVASCVMLSFRAYLLVVVSLWLLVDCGCCVLFVVRCAWFVYCVFGVRWCLILAHCSLCIVRYVPIVVCGVWFFVVLVSWCL